MSEVQHRTDFRTVAPAAAAAIGIVGALVIGSLMTRPAPAGSAPEIVLASPAPLVSPQVAAPQPPEPPLTMPGAALDQAPGAAPPMQVEIVVKFKDDAKVKPICDLYWKDAAGAKAKFDAFKAGRPELANLVLDRVTYSNELVLTHKTAGPASVPAMRQIAKDLAGKPDISYAEPNLTAFPGGR